MRNLNKFIIERLQLNKDTKFQQYQFFPKDFDELKSLLKQLLKKRGKNANLNDIDVSKVTAFVDKDENGLFEELDPHNIDISQWDVSKVTNMMSMFYECENFDCDLSEWDVRNVENMRYMFDSCKNFKGNGLEYWKPIKCKNMNYMFSGCKKFDCNLGNWNVNNVISMFEMFSGCQNFKGNGLEYWNPIKCGKIENMLYMFADSGVEKNKNYPDWYKTYEKIK